MMRYDYSSSNPRMHQDDRYHDQASGGFQGDGNIYYDEEPPRLPTSSAPVLVDKDPNIPLFALPAQPQPQVPPQPPLPRSFWQRAQNVLRCAGPSPLDDVYNANAAFRTSRTSRAVIENLDWSNNQSAPQGTNTTHNYSSHYSTVATVASASASKGLYSQDILDADSGYAFATDNENGGSRARYHEGSQAAYPIVQAPSFAVRPPLQTTREQDPTPDVLRTKFEDSPPPTELRLLWGNSIVKQLFPRGDLATPTAAGKLPKTPASVFTPQRASYQHEFVEVSLDDGGEATGNSKQHTRNYHSKDDNGDVRAFKMYQHSLAQFAVASSTKRWSSLGAMEPPTKSADA